VAVEEPPRVAKLRQDRAHRTRQALLEAASSLWQERGYDAVAVSDICERAGVSKGTFFYHFPAKEHLLVELVAAGGTEAVAAAVDEQLAAGAPLAEVFRAAVAVLAAGPRYAPRELVGRAALEVLRGPRRARPDDDRPELRDVYTRAFRAAIERGELPGTFHPGELGAITNWILLQGTLFWALGVSGPLTLEQILWRRVQLVVHGAGRLDLDPWLGPTDPTPAPSARPS
jgi:AcrR family transcriptional regulator